MRKVDPRSESERDRDRLLYSSAFRRLGGVTQVITPPGYAPPLHNRLTHSLKVAQVARSISSLLISQAHNAETLNRLGGLDPITCEAAALAHDLGHPPFGHIGEQVLDRKAREALGLDDGFEGNAQTMRIVTTGFQRSVDSQGLDLTYSTLAAIAKYPWTRGAKTCRRDTESGHYFCAQDLGHNCDPKTCARSRRWNKFNFYEEQQELVARIREFSPVGRETQTLEASVMDLADDIAYAVHDLEDFFLTGFIDSKYVLRDLEAYDHDRVESPLLSLVDELKGKYPNRFSEDDFGTQVSDLLAELKKFFALTERISATKPAARAAALTSAWIGKYINPEVIELSERPLWDHGPHISLRSPQWHGIQILKWITRTYIIRQSDIALLQHGQQRILSDLVDMLLKWSRDDFDRLPRRLQEEMQVALDLSRGMLEMGYGPAKHAPRGVPERAIVDYLCGLTDAQTFALYENLSGSRMHSGGISEAY